MVNSDILYVAVFNVGLSNHLDIYRWSKYFIAPAKYWLTRGQTFCMRYSDMSHDHFAILMLTCLNYLDGTFKFRFQNHFLATVWILICLVFAGWRKNVWFCMKTAISHHSKTSTTNNIIDNWYNPQYSQLTSWSIERDTHSVLDPLLCLIYINYLSGNPPRT